MTDRRSKEALHAYRKSCSLLSLIPRHQKTYASHITRMRGQVDFALREDEKRLLQPGPRGML